MTAGAQDGQHYLGHHGQGDVPIPALPVADFVVVQPAFALGRLECNLDFPAPPGHLGQSPQTGLGSRRIGEVVGKLGLLFAAAPRRVF